MNDHNPQSTYSPIHWYDWPGLALFFALMLVVFLQFFTRYFLNDSLAWTEEIARYLLILMVYAGAVSALVRGEHIALEVVHRYAPIANAKPLSLLSESISLGYYLLLVVGAAFLASSNNQLLISIPIPKAFIYGFIALCCLALCISCLARMKLRQDQSAEEIHRELVESETALAISTAANTKEPSE